MYKHKHKHNTNCAYVRTLERSSCAASVLCTAGCLALQVLQGADCRHADSFVNRARLKGSFRDTANGSTVDRLVGAYEVRSSLKATH